MVVIDTPLVQRDDEQQMNDIPKLVADNPADQVDHPIPENDEQPIEQHDPQENVDATLRRYTTVRKSVIPSGYIVYLQESNYNIEAQRSSLHRGFSSKLPSHLVNNLLFEISLKFC